MVWYEIIQRTCNYSYLLFVVEHSTCYIQGSIANCLFNVSLGLGLTFDFSVYVTFYQLSIQKHWCCYLLYVVVWEDSIYCLQGSIAHLKY